jgi:hypothetical protein
MAAYQGDQFSLALNPQLQPLPSIRCRWSSRLGRHWAIGHLQGIDIARLVRERST